MADVWAVKDGVWSDTTVWNTGALPGVSDWVYPNGFTVTIDGTFTVERLLSLWNDNGGAFTPDPAITPGGYFKFTDGAHITATHPQGGFFRADVNQDAWLLYFDLPAGQSASATGDVNARTRNTGPGTARRIITIAGGGTFNHVGNWDCFATYNSYIGVLFEAAGELNLTGDIYFEEGWRSGFADMNGKGGVMNLTGSIVLHQTSTDGGTNGALRVRNGDEFNVVGDLSYDPEHLTNTSQVYGIRVYDNGMLHVVGNVSTRRNANMIYSDEVILPVDVGRPHLVIIHGNLANYEDWSALFAYNALVVAPANGPMMWEMAKRDEYGSPVLTTTFYTAEALPGLPVAGDVRAGTTFGPIGELTGSLEMPAPSQVRAGVAVDATVGTGALTVSDVWDYLIASGFASGSIGERLAAAASTEAVGEIWASG